MAVRIEGFGDTPLPTALVAATSAASDAAGIDVQVARGLANTGIYVEGNEPMPGWRDDIARRDDAMTVHVRDAVGRVLVTAACTILQREGGTLREFLTDANFHVGPPARRFLFFDAADELARRLVGPIAWTGNIALVQDLRGTPRGRFLTDLALLLARAFGLRALGGRVCASFMRRSLVEALRGNRWGHSERAEYVHWIDPGQPPIPLVLTTTTREDVDRLVQSQVTALESTGIPPVSP